MHMARWAAGTAGLCDWTHTKADAAGAGLLVAIAEAAFGVTYLDRPPVGLHLEVPMIIIEVAWARMKRVMW